MAHMAWRTAPELNEATERGFTVIYVVSLEDVVSMSVQLRVSMLKNADCITSVTLREKNNNNNNNNNIYLLQLGCHPVAVVILHVNKT